MTTQQERRGAERYDNPWLNGWRSAREAAFPEWARSTGGGWDFTPASLDRLEEVIRGRFSSYEEVAAASDDPFFLVACWYFGEVLNAAYGAVWQGGPEPPVGIRAGHSPIVALPEDLRDEDLRDDDEDDYDDDLDDEDEEHEDDLDDEGYDEDEELEDGVPLCAPDSEICALFLRGPNYRLRDQCLEFVRYLGARAYEPVTPLTRWDEQRRLRDWINNVGYAADRYRAEVGESHADFSPRSLRVLEARLLRQHATAASLPEPHVVNDEVMYVGEVLLRIVGGSWSWGGKRQYGQPVVSPDPGLGHAPVFPHELVRGAMEERHGAFLLSTAERMRRAVSERQALRPGWEPVRTPTPGLS